MHYQLCDLFLMPNREMPDKDTEGFGLVFLEANACGKPVIGGLAGGAVEAVQHERNGLSVDGDDPRAIAAAVKRIFTEPGLAKRLAAEGLILARESSFHSCARQFQRLYQGLGES
jgi:phosphatidylinositol alpha-1,6-mannosyltransferase